jgi:hypothetical protein
MSMAFTLVYVEPRLLDGNNGPMKHADSTTAPDQNAAGIRQRITFRNFILTGVFLPYAVIASIGVVVVVVIGSIAFNAFKNHGLIPPPNTLDRYECTGATAPFTIFYLHGTERVKIKSAEGILEGTLHQNQFDWASFSNDSTQLGFLPPSEISFEDAGSLHIKLPGAAQVTCQIAVKHVGERRAIVQ